MSDAGIEQQPPPAPELRLRLFGGFVLERASGEAISVPLRKGEALLAYLGANLGKSSSRERLAALLWGESDQQRARQSLRQALFALTREFAQYDVAVLRMESQMVTLDPAAIWVDVQEFERLIGEGTRESLIAATALYAGEFLSGLAVGAADFEDWLTENRARYRELAMKASEDLLAHHRADGDIVAAIETVSQALRVDPFREDLHRELMELYLARGMRSSALTQYRSCRTFLQRELDVPPDEETEALYRRILEQGPSAAAESLEQPDRTGRAAPGRGADLALAETMVGRSAEMRALNSLLDNAMGGACRFVAIVGEAGVGKSHLVGTFLQDLAVRQIATLSARGRQAERTVPFGLWPELLTSVSGDDSSLPDDPDEAAGDAGRRTPDQSRRFFDSAAAALQARAAQGPLVYLLEDLQWADEESLRLASYLIRSLADMPVLFIGTLRSEDLSAQGLLSDVLRDLERDGSLTVITLQPLTREETAELVDHLQETMGGETRRKLRLSDVWALSEGNPQIVVEALSEDMPQSGHGDPRRTRLPDRVRKDLSRMLMPLGETARQLASWASVMGPRVDYAVLREAAQMDADTLVRAIEELVAARILRMDGDELVFERQRVQRALYEDLLAPRRQAIHVAVAQAVETVHAGKLEGHYQVLALHYRGAGDMSRALDCDVAAAQAELNRGARVAARKLFQFALKSVHASQGSAGLRAQEADARLGLAAIAEIEQDLEAAEGFLREIETGFDLLDNGRQRADVLMGLARIAYMKGDVDGAYHAGQRALAEARRAGEEGLWLPGERLLARLHLLNGSYAQAVDRLTRSAERARALDLREEEADYAAVIGLVQGLRGDFEAAFRHAERAVGIAESLANERCLAACLQFLGVIQTWRGNFAAALESFAKATEIAEARGDLLRLYSLCGHRGFALAGAERPVEGLVELKAAEDMAKRLNTTFMLPLFQAWTAEASLQAGKDEDALHMGREAFRLAAEQNQSWARSVALRALSRVLSQPEAGDLAGAEKAIRSALGDQEGLGLKFEQARSLVVHAKVLRAAGNLRRSSEVYAEASELFRQMQMTGDFDSARHMAEALKPTGNSSS